MYDQLRQGMTPSPAYDELNNQILELYSSLGCFSGFNNARGKHDDPDISSQLKSKHTNLDYIEQLSLSEPRDLNSYDPPWILSFDSPELAFMDSQRLSPYMDLPREVRETPQSPSNALLTNFVSIMHNEPWTETSAGLSVGPKSQRTCAPWDNHVDLIQILNMGNCDTSPDLEAPKQDIEKSLLDSLHLMQPIKPMLDQMGYHKSFKLASPELPTRCNSTESLLTASQATTCPQSSQGNSSIELPTIPKSSAHPIVGNGDFDSEKLNSLDVERRGVQKTGKGQVESPKCGVDPSKNARSNRLRNANLKYPEIQRQQITSGDENALRHRVPKEMTSQPKMNLKRFCSSLGRTECRRGKFCAFAHSREEIMAQLYTEAEELAPSADFFMMRFKTIWCPYGMQHDWHKCLYAHTYQDCRRSPLLGYQSRACSFWEKTDQTAPYNSRCPYGAQCALSHGSKEQLYHPQYYKTMACSDYVSTGICPRRTLCAFYHELSEKRYPNAAESIQNSTSDDMSSRPVVLRSPILNLQPDFFDPPVFDTDSLYKGRSVDHVHIPETDAKYRRKKKTNRQASQKFHVHRHGESLGCRDRQSPSVCSPKPYSRLRIIGCPDHDNHLYGPYMPEHRKDHLRLC